MGIGQTIELKRHYFIMFLYEHMIHVTPHHVQHKNGKLHSMCYNMSNTHYCHVYLKRILKRNKRNNVGEVSTYAVFVGWCISIIILENCITIPFKTWNGSNI